MMELQIIQNILPGLTTVVQPLEQIAQTAITVLKQRLNNEPTDTEYILPVTLHKGITELNKSRD